MRRFDVIVVGAGGIGTAAAAHLARRGASVLAVDRFPLGHSRGSSHGQTRLIRLAYYEHPDYVPLLRRARELWRDLERETATPLLTECGLLSSGPADGDVLVGTLRSAAAHGLAIEHLPAREAMRRWPAFTIPDGWESVFEPTAGHLAVEACVRAHADVAVRHAAVIEAPHDVRGWRVEGAGVVVETAKESFSAGRLVLCPGSWATWLLQLPMIPFTVLRKSLFWYAPSAGLSAAAAAAIPFLSSTAAGSSSPSTPAARSSPIRSRWIGGSTTRSRPRSKAGWRITFPAWAACGLPTRSACTRCRPITTSWSACTRSTRR